MGLNAMNIGDQRPMTLVGGAGVIPEVLEHALALAPRVAAADGGADSALAQGIMPDVVIGDMDSITPQALARIPHERLHKIAEQDTTDFDKCLRSLNVPLILGVGFSGARQDHQLATFNSLVRHASRRCILLNEIDLVFLAPPTVQLDLPCECPVSLFPMGAVEGVSDGLEWPIGGLSFAPDGRVGTSNRASGPVELSVTSPKMLVILPAHTLDIVVQALTKTTAHWPES